MGRVPERTVDVVSLHWYVRPAEALPGLARRWAQACVEHLPEALPQRYGDLEPLRGRWHTGGGEDGFVAAHAAASQFLFLGPGGARTDALPAVLGGALPAAGRPSYFGPTDSAHLTVERGAWDDPELRARLDAFVLAVATGPGTIAVVADDEDGRIWTGRTLVYVGGPVPPYLAPLGEWLGLPPERPRWCWLGPDYAHALRKQVRGTAAAGGLVVDPDGPWVPEPWRARMDEIDPVRRPAPRMPRGSGRPFWARWR
jgi:hypothetical protein